jgi:hypothetical protein
MYGNPLQGPLTFQDQLKDLYHVWESTSSFVTDRWRPTVFLLQGPAELAEH